MGGVLSQLNTEDRIMCIGRCCPDHVAGIDVLQVYIDPSLVAEIGADGVTEINADVVELEIPRLVFFVRTLSQMLLARAFGHDNHRVVLRLETMLQRGKQTILAFQIERDFGYQDEIYLIQPQCSVGGDETAHPPHYFDETYPVGSALGLDVS